MGWFDDLRPHDVSDIWDKFTGASQANKANQANYQLQQQQQQWEENMSNTAVQRRMSDLKAAGINPLMAAGQAADVPNVQPAHMEAKPSWSSGIASAVEAYKTFGMSKLFDAQANKANAEANYTAQITPGASAYQQAQTAQALSSVEVNRATAELHTQAAKKAIADAQYVTQQTVNAAKEFDKIAAEVENVRANTSVQEQERILKVAQTSVQALDASLQAQMIPWVVQQARAESVSSIARMGVTKQDAESQTSMWGKLLSRVFGPISKNLPGVSSAATGAAGYALGRK